MTGQARPAAYRVTVAGRPPPSLREVLGVRFGERAIRTGDDTTVVLVGGIDEPALCALRPCPGTADRSCSTSIPTHSRALRPVPAPLTRVACGAAAHR